MSNGNSARKGPIPRSSGSVPRPQLACAGVKLCDLKPEEVKKQMELHREHYEVVWFLLLGSLPWCTLYKCLCVDNLKSQIVFHVRV